ncbi:MAG: anti-sigma factor [Candidatus Elarobacter sp.]
MNVHDDVEAYVLGALDAAERRAFVAHLAACDACRDAVASYAEVVHALRSLPVDAPPPAPSIRRAPLALANLRWIGALAVAAALAFFLGRPAVPDGDVAAIAEMVTGRPREVALLGPSAQGRAIVGAAGRRTAFVVSGLPPAPRGRGYQVWIRGDAVRSPGMLHRTREGLEVLVVPGDMLAGARHVGVTVEPAGGSPKRTGPPQVTGDVI